MKYDFLIPKRIYFGWDRFNEVGKQAAGLGKRAFIISGSRTLENSGVLDRLEGMLEDSGVESVRLGSIHHEPRVKDVDHLSQSIRRHCMGHSHGNLVIGIGGGSALDLAKAVSAMATNDQATSVKDCLEGVGRGLKIEAHPLPMLAIPTTSGTGSECTKNAVISSDDDEETAFKKSLRADSMIPAAVLIDPHLAASMPTQVTAQTGMDAITQLIEAAISCRAQPIPSALAMHGLALALPSIEVAANQPENRQAREAMAHAALLSGMALANAGLGLAHGVAAALGIIAGIPHGLACAVMLPAALRVNRQARQAEIAAFSRLLTTRSFQSDEHAAEAAAGLICELNRRLGIPMRLRDVGVHADQIPAVVKSSRGNSMSGNPRQVEDQELTIILENML